MRHAIRVPVAFALLSAMTSVAADAADVDTAIARARSAAGGSLRLRQAQPGGPVAFLAVDGDGIALPVPRAAGADVGARAFLQSHGALFGLAGAADAGVVRSTIDDLGTAHVRLRQQRGGVPVTGSGLSVHLRGGRV